MKRLSVAVTALALFAACTDERGPTSARPPAISAEISDAAHGLDGNPHFFWLPPMVANPASFNGPFNPRLSPVVQICDQRATPCPKGHEHVRFTMSSGPGGATVGVDVAGQKYMVNWNTSAITEPVGTSFRIAVLVHDQFLGFADVDIVATGKAKNANTGEDIALVDGRTLPIKFRIEEGAIAASCAAASTPLDCAEGTAPPTATTTIITGGDGFGNQAGTLITTGALSQTVTVTIRRNLARPCIPPPFDLPQYQGCYDFFTDPGPNTFNSGPGIDPVVVGMCIEADLTRSAGQHAHIAQFDPGQPVRILPQVSAAFLNCDASDPYHPGEGTTGYRTPRGSNLLGLARNGLDLLGRYLTPRPLVAAHIGVGGTPPGYSTFAWTLPVIVSKDPASDGQTAAPGTAVAINPSVIARDSGGAPAAAVIVHFHALQGAVADTVDTTDVNGIASAGTWTLGGSPGLNSLVATSVGAAGSPLTFTATGTAPVTLILDQANDPETSTSFDCGGSGQSLYQSFTPALSPLVAIELRFRAGGGFTEGVETTVKIRDGSPTGTVLRTATVFVTPQAAETQLLVRFVFSDPLAVTLGSTLVIEWLATDGTILSWMGSQSDTYPGGTMFGCAMIAPENPPHDLNFKTFSQ